MNAAYLTAAIPEPFTILGRRLKPYSLGHELLFQRFDVNFSNESSKAPWHDDLILGTLLCSHDYAGALSALTSSWLPLRLRLWAYRCGKFDVKEKVQMFATYVADATRLPLYDSLREPDPDKPVIMPGSPSVQSIKVTLMSEFGLSEIEALNTPYSLAIWNYLTFQENRGYVHIVTEKDLEERARLEEQKKILDPKVTEWANRVMELQRKGEA